MHETTSPTSLARLYASSYCTCPEKVPCFNVEPVQSALRDCPHLDPVPRQVPDAPARFSALTNASPTQFLAMSSSNDEEAFECISPSESSESDFQPDDQSSSTTKDIHDEWRQAFIAMQRLVRAPFRKAWTRREILGLMQAPLVCHLWWK